MASKNLIFSFSLYLEGWKVAPLPSSHPSASPVNIHQLNSRSEANVCLNKHHRQEISAWITKVKFDLDNVRKHDDCQQEKQCGDIL